MNFPIKQYEIKFTDKNLMNKEDKFYEEDIIAVSCCNKKILLNDIIAIGYDIEFHFPLFTLHNPGMYAIVHISEKDSPQYRLIDILSFMKKWYTEPLNDEEFSLLFDFIDLDPCEKDLKCYKQSISIPLRYQTLRPCLCDYKIDGMITLEDSFDESMSEIHKLIIKVQFIQDKYFTEYQNWVEYYFSP